MKRLNSLGLTSYIYTFVHIHIYIYNEITFFIVYCYTNDIFSVYLVIFYSCTFIFFFFGNYETNQQFNFKSQNKNELFLAS